MADEATTAGTALNGTALDGQNQPPETAESTQAKSPSQTVDFEKELQRIRSEQGRIRQQAQLAEQRAQQAEWRAQQAEMAGMDDFQRAVRRAELAEQAVAQRDQVIAENELLRIRFERISELSRKTGVPLALLEQAQTPDDMAFIVADYKEQHLAEQVKERTAKAKEKDAANKVDVGGGAVRGNESDIESRFKKAKGNGLELAKLLIRQ